MSRSALNHSIVWKQVASLLKPTLSLLNWSLLFLQTTNTGNIQNRNVSTPISPDFWEIKCLTCGLRLIKIFEIYKWDLSKLWRQYSKVHSSAASSFDWCCIRVMLCFLFNTRYTNIVGENNNIKLYLSLVFASHLFCISKAMLSPITPILEHYTV